MINISVTDVQKAKEELQKQLKELMTDKMVLVGIHEDAGEHDGGITNAQLGASLHFGANINHPGGTPYGYKTRKDMENGKVQFLKKGTGFAVIGETAPHKINIPARPWLDVGVQSGNEDYISIIESHGDDLDSALELVGQVAQGKVQEYMTNLTTPPNAQSTIKKKGSSNPLIDTGALRQSVTYTVTNQKPEEGIG